MHSKLRALWLGGVVALNFTAQSAGAQSAQSCDNVCLKGFVDSYFDALAQRDPSKLPVAADVKFTENGRVLDFGLGLGFWRTAGKPINYRDYVLDPQTGNAAALTALAEYDGIAQMALRLKIVNRRITEIETYVVRLGDQRWFAPGGLEHMSDIFTQTVPAATRHTREQLVAAANSYFNAIETEGTPQFAQAPFAVGIKRFENGLQTTNVQANAVIERHRMSPDAQLEAAFYKGILVRDRRFPVIDIERGIVLAFVTFRRADPDTTTLLIAEMFKVTDGKLREIRAVMLDAPNGAGTGWSAGATTR